MCEEENEKSVWDIYKAKVLTIDYLGKKLAALVLCRIHDYTRYKICRSFSDLFYWPDGFCADTVVVILALAIGIWSVWDDVSLVLQATAECYKDAKDLFRIGFKLMSDEDDWDDFT